VLNLSLTVTVRPRRPSWRSSRPTRSACLRSQAARMPRSAVSVSKVFSAL